MIKVLKLLGVLTASLPLVQCTSMFERPGDPRYAPVMAEYEAPPEPILGSLYNSGRGLSLYEDIKAHRVGDIITVVLNEKTDASKSAQTKFDKESLATIQDPTLINTSPDFGLSKLLPIPLKTTENLTLETRIDATREFEGNSNSNQNNQLTGTISVTVKQILPNGYLMVQGEKWLTLNTGDEFIRISGIIRPEDIGPDNTILSDRVADAKIAYSGRGVLQNATNPGWIMKILASFLWPL